MYDPVTARFMQEDTYRGQANDPLSLNLYTYCHNEPLMYSDPSGHFNIFSGDDWSQLGRQYKYTWNALTDPEEYAKADKVIRENATTTEKIIAGISEGYLREGTDAIPGIGQGKMIAEAYQGQEVIGGRKLSDGERTGKVVSAGIATALPFAIKGLVEWKPTIKVPDINPSIKPDVPELKIGTPQNKLEINTNNKVVAELKTKNPVDTNTKTSNGYSAYSESTKPEIKINTGNTLTGAGDGNTGNGFVRFADNYADHIVKLDSTVPRARGIGGAHNMNEFMSNNINIVGKTNHPTVNGIYEIEYQIPALDSKTGTKIGWKSQTFTKTVYEPSEITDTQFLQMGRQAVAEAQNAGRLTTTSRSWSGFAPNGLEFMGYVDKTGAVKTFFPVVTKK